MTPNQKRSQLLTKLALCHGIGEIALKHATQWVASQSDTSILKIVFNKEFVDQFRRVNKPYPFSLSDINKRYQNLTQNNSQIVNYFDNDYPAKFKNNSKIPKIFSCIGNVKLWTQAQTFIWGGEYGKLNNKQQNCIVDALKNTNQIPAFNLQGYPSIMLINACLTANIPIIIYLPENYTWYELRVSYPLLWQRLKTTNNHLYLLISNKIMPKYKKAIRYHYNQSISVNYVKNFKYWIAIYTKYAIFINANHNCKQTLDALVASHCKINFIDRNYNNRILWKCRKVMWQYQQSMFIRQFNQPWQAFDNYEKLKNHFIKKLE